MAQQVINNGETGLLVRNKINANFTELYTGPVNRIPKYNLGGGYVPSLIFDDGANVGIGNVTPGARLHVTSLTSDMTYLHLNKVLVANDTWMTLRGDAVGNGTVYGSIYTPDGSKVALNAVNGMVLSVGALTPAVTVLPNGNVGIGTSNPPFRLYVETQGDQNVAYFSGFSTNAIVYIGCAAGFQSSLLFQGGGVNKWSIDSVGATGALRIWDQANGVERVTFLNNGNVGIGVATPSNTLTIKGSFRLIGVVDNNSGVRISTPAGDTIKIGFHVSDDNERFYMQYSDANLATERIGFYKNLAGLAEVMSLMTNGNVGIGTIPSGANTKLHVLSNNANGTVVRIENTAPNGKIYGIGSNFVSGTGEFAIYDYTVGTLRFIITNSGNVGIGLTAPSAKFSVVPAVNHVAGGNPTVRIGEATANDAYGLGLSFYQTPSAGYAGKIQSITGGAPSNLLLNPEGGNVGIGTTAPPFQLSMLGDIPTGNALVFQMENNGVGGNQIRLKRNAGSVQLWIIENAEGTANLGFYNNGTRMNIGGDGTVTALAFTPTSDKRLKKNIRPTPSVLTKALTIASLVSEYTLIESGKDQVGFIAQELLVIAPEYVNVPSNPKEMMGVNYGQMVALLYKAVAELNEKIKSN